MTKANSSWYWARPEDIVYTVLIQRNICPPDYN